MVDGPPQPADDDNAKAQERRRLVWRRAGAGLLVVGLVILLLACVLWIPSWLYPSLTETDLRGVSDAAKVQELKGARLKLQNDARTTLVQGIGAVLVLTGAGIGASVTLRQIRETATANRNQLRLGEQGQVTDRYATAVEQLGHDKAPVRLGALHSLERLAQDNPQYRQTVVDVVCAYLRMPYTFPAQTELGAAQVKETALPANSRDRAPHPAPGRGPAREELQVRQTAQRLLADHLRCPPETSGQEAQLLPPSPQETFWPGISLDLTGAALVDFDFAGVSVLQARFGGATFQDKAGFDDATFQRGAGFAGAIFQDKAGFAGAIFQDKAGFDDATFQGFATFYGATFQGFATFHKATFQAGAGFGGITFESETESIRARHEGATFQGYAGFTGATFQGFAAFGGATFQDEAGFSGVTFHIAGFSEATFQDEAGFDSATFQRGAGFGGSTFQGNAWFWGVIFQGYAVFDGTTFAGPDRARTFGGAQVLHLDDPDLNKRRVWPDGYTVRPDPADPTRGTLVPCGAGGGAGAGRPPT